MDICCASFSCVRSICCGTTATNRSTRQGDHFVPGPRNREDKKGRRARCCARSGSTAAARVGTWHSWSRRVRLRIRSSYGRFSQRSLVFVQAAPVRAPGMRERRGGGGGRRGRREETVRRTCDGEQYRCRRRSRMSSRSVAGQVAAIVLRVLCELVNARTGSPPRTGPVQSPRACGQLQEQMSGFQANSGRHFTGSHGRSIL